MGSHMNIEQLIALVQQRPQLWDRGNKFHSNRNVLDKCWRDIAAEMREDENKIRKKWKYLRDQFSVEFGKIPPAGCEDEVLGYEPKWRYYRPLQFLEEVVTPRVTTKNPRRDHSSDSRDSSAPGSPSRPSRADKRRHENGRERRERRKRRRASDSANEEHLHFFKSLLPHVRNIPPHLLLSFRSRVQRVVEEFAYRSEPAAGSPRSNETYFITCVPDQAAKLEPAECAEETPHLDDDGDEDDSSSHLSD